MTDAEYEAWLATLDIEEDEAFLPGEERPPRVRRPKAATDAERRERIREQHRITERRRRDRLRWEAQHAQR